MLPDLWWRSSTCWQIKEGALNGNGCVSSTLDACVVMRVIIFVEPLCEPCMRYMSSRNVTTSSLCDSLRQSSKFAPHVPSAVRHPHTRSVANEESGRSHWTNTRITQSHCLALHCSKQCSGNITWVTLAQRQRCQGGRTSEPRLSSEHPTRQSIIKQQATLSTPLVTDPYCRGGRARKRDTWV